MAETTLADEPLLGHLIRVAQMVARQEGLHETGFRLVINNGPRWPARACRTCTCMCWAGGQSAWPPG